MNSVRNCGISSRILPLLLVVVLVISVLPAYAANGTEATATLSPFTKNAYAGDAVTFSEADFTANITGEDELTGIVITSLPDEESGALCLGDRELLVGEAVTAENLNELCFEPSGNQEVSSSFSVIPVFSGSNGGITEVEVATVKKENTAPTAEALEYETVKNIAITCKFGGSDADGDVLTYEIVDMPKKGEIALSEQTPETFVYTPYQNKTGTDSFTYVAVDPSGLKSEPAKITIKITKNGAKMTYADMDGNPAHLAAIKLAEEGVLIGQKMGDSYFFYPDETVSRGEFVAMAITCLGIEVTAPVSKTGFADDSDIPAWVKPYLSAALKNGIITGVSMSDGRTVFRAGNTLTKAEAAVIISNATNLAASGKTPVFADAEEVPAWAEQAVAYTSACGIISANADGNLEPMQEVTRAEATEMLYQAMKIAEDDEGGLLSRVFS